MVQFKNILDQTAVIKLSAYSYSSSALPLLSPSNDIVCITRKLAENRMKLPHSKLSFLKKARQNRVTTAIPQWTGETDNRERRLTESLGGAEKCSANVIVATGAHVFHGAGVRWLGLIIWRVTHGRVWHARIDFPLCLPRVFTEEVLSLFIYPLDFLLFYGVATTTMSCVSHGQSYESRLICFFVKYSIIKRSAD